MAITSELLGKLGGADVEVIPFSVETTRDLPSAIITMLEPPIGDTWWVAVMGKTVRGSTSSSGTPYISIGDHRTYIDKIGGAFVRLNYQTMVTFNRGNSSLRYTEPLVGEIYIVKGVDI